MTGGQAQLKERTLQPPSKEVGREREKGIKTAQEKDAYLLHKSKFSASMGALITRFLPPTMDNGGLSVGCLCWPLMAAHHHIANSHSMNVLFDG